MITKYLIKKFLIESLLSGSVLFVISYLIPGKEVFSGTEIFKNILISFVLGGLIGLLFLFKHSRKYNLNFLYYNLGIKYRRIYAIIVAVYEIIIISIVRALWVIIH